jgi:hypothetical protein
MDHKRINKLLKKISNLNQSIKEDEEFSSMEWEHMLNYIKKLYDEVSSAKLSEHVPEVLAIPVKEEVAAPIVVAPVVEPEPIVEEVEVPEPVVEEIPEPAPEPAPAPAPEPVVVLPQVDPALAALFEEEGGTDLSDKLASRPVKKLSKAMGINEKIFTVKELFGGDQAEFDNMMTALDGLGSFDEAKNVLIGSVAEKYEWASDKKLKKATTFIKLVRRRYS